MNQKLTLSNSHENSVKNNRTGSGDDRWIFESDSALTFGLDQVHSSYFNCVLSAGVHSFQITERNRARCLQFSMWCALGSISFCRGLDQRGCGCVVDSDAGTCAAAIKSRADRVRFDHGCTYCLFRICTHIHTYVALEPQFMVGTMVERLSCDYLSYKMDYTGSQMMITIKLTSFAWFYTGT